MTGHQGAMGDVTVRHLNGVQGFMETHQSSVTLTRRLPFAELEHNAGNQHGDFNREKKQNKKNKTDFCDIRPCSFDYFLPRKGASHLVTHQ